MADFMADNRSSTVAAGDFREAVCIDGGRVYDSCCDRDCLEDLRVYFSVRGQELIEQAVSIRCREAEVINVYIDVEPVHLNRGFYCCDLTFFFAIRFDVCLAQNTSPVTVEGVCAFDKKVILYGSEGKVKVFSNEFAVDCDNDAIRPRSNLPKCVVECVDPVALSSRVCEVKDCCENRIMPLCISERLGGEVYNRCACGDKMVLVTLGLFTIVQLIRNVQMLIPVYDFCIPEKECSGNINDNPCEVFGRLRFPTEDFFPPRECDIDHNPFGCTSC